ncbi:MAG: RNA polymerase-binding protein RbpA [Nocardioidaceae bacterium]
MSDRVLRGARLGGQSFEDERGIEFAPRQQVAYICDKGHAFEIPMSEDAEVPTVWECARCGAEAYLVDGAEPESKKEKPVRTHWDMLRERRSIPELEEILSERLTMLRAGEIGPTHLHRTTTRSSTSKRKAKKPA